MARRFLYFIAGATVLIIALRLALIFFPEYLSELEFVPNGPFRDRPALAANAYDKPDMWVSSPMMEQDAEPAEWLPAGAHRAVDPARAQVFFIHPTSYIEKDRWNADLSDATSRKYATLFVKAMASPFNSAETVWAPRYRQAAVGSFLTDKPQAEQAIDLAYRDVLTAFDYFLRMAPQDRPIVLVGHSQGAFLLRRLLRDRVAGTPLAQRMIAAYVIGWPVSIAHDLPAMGLPACGKADDSGCVLSWLSVADPADTAMMTKAYARRRGLDGQSVSDSPFLCTNPLTGTPGSSADASANAGTLVPDFRNGTGELTAQVVPAACAPDHFLHIGPPPKLDLDAFVLPSNNYHVYDLTLFWANVRSDFQRRSAAWLKAHS